MSVLRRKLLTKRFMKEKGYTNFTSHHGIRKNSGRFLYDFISPDKMLGDFVRWLKVEEKNTKSVKEKTGREHPNAKLSEYDAIAIWETKGIAGTTITARAFGITPKSVRDIWRGISWKKTIQQHEASK